jgi:hypothetical protein
MVVGEVDVALRLAVADRVRDEAEPSVCVES